MQQRWAQKRLAEAERSRLKKKNKKNGQIAFQSDREARAERAMKIAEKYMNPPAPTATPSPAPTAPAQSTTNKRRGACSLVRAALAYQSPSNTEEVAAPQPEPAPAAASQPEPADRAVSADAKKGDRLERLRELLEAPEEEEESGGNRDLTRL